MTRSGELSVVTVALLAILLLATSAPASAQGASSAPTGAAYTPPGYALTVPSGTTAVTPTGASSSASLLTPRAARETTSVRGLWIPGLIGLPVSYVVTWVVGSVTLPPGSSAADLAYVPVLGPWLVLGQDLNGSSPDFYATMGVIQAASLVCLVLGLAIRLPKAPVDAPQVSLRPTPSGAVSATIQF